MTGDPREFFVMDQSWAAKYPGAKAGILVVENVENISVSPELERSRAAIETGLRKKFPGATREDLNNLPVIAAYNRYYKNFGKTYHVRSQVESIINGKSLSSGSAVLTAMFMAEVENMLLTAGHDLDLLDLPVRIAVCTGGETFVDIRGSEKKMQPNDTMMADGKGIISSIILGPDGRTKITPATKNILFAVYAPSEIAADLVEKHLSDMEKSVRLFSPDLQTRLIKVFEA